MRFLIALWAAKASAVLLRLLGRNATQFPGALAMRLCPGFLAKVGKPARIIAITGSNGKTTTTNFIVAALEALGVRLLSNKLGSNLEAGIATSLALGAKLTGAPRCAVAVFEVDERASKLIYAHVTPELLLITNLTNDTIKRNAHPSYIRWIIEQALPSSTKLVLNAADPVSAMLAVDHKRVFFALDAVADYRALSWGDGVLRASTPTGEQEYPLIHDNRVNVANEVAAVAVLSEFGVSEIARGLAAAKVPGSRYQKEMISWLSVVSMTAKSASPPAVSTALRYAADAPGRKALIVAYDDIGEFDTGCENTCWYYDVDFTALTDPSFVFIVFAGPRHLDAVVRALLAGVDSALIRSTPAEDAAADLVKLDGVDKLFLLHDSPLVNSEPIIKAGLRRRLGVSA
ncbi:MAG: MurT ligase domain-containing protein [Propionibacteriaceae bacterium]|jgi:UDP-N-acetylmuramyl pentapeptide synthase|nr:MurT ligase domain-containing protein [Propionibacteriaceae bacterium]